MSHDPLSLSIPTHEAILYHCIYISFVSITDVTRHHPDEVTITVVETTDVHGNFFPTNYITRSQWPGSLARVATYVDSLRAEKGADNVILLDNGDLLQGQPTVYYYNFIDTVSPHVAADIQRFMAYDAVTLGNHDIETGHDVYDRFIARSSAPRCSVPTSSPRPPASPTSPPIPS